MAPGAPFFNRIFPRAPFLSWFPALLLGLWALTSAYNLRWTADDAFISFRYARAAAAGNGLTFNPGERIEGYTNFLWTVLLIPAEFLDLETERFAWTLGLLSYCALLLVLYRAMTKSWPGFFAAFCFAEHARVFATSGLETSLFTLLVTAGLVCIARETERPQSKGFLFLALAVLTRPDAALIYAVAALHSSRPGRENLNMRWFNAQLRTHLPALLVILPVWIGKTFYYGDVVPNTFYAKSAYQAFASQGVAYALLFAQSYWLLSTLAVCALLLPQSWRGPGGLYAAALVAWISYVIYVGGDFMFARFLVPVLPAACLLLHETATGLLGKKPVLRATVHAAVCLSLLFRPDPFKEAAVVGHISDEHRIYTREGREVLKKAAMDIRADLLDGGLRVGFVGAQAAFLYYWYPLFGIESETGLTDRAIAAQILSVRGKVGHEKQASFDYLKSRDVHLLMRPPLPGWPERTVRLRGIPGRMTVVHFDEHVFQHLEKSGVLQEKETD